MSLKRLNIPEMVSLTSSWVETEHPDRKALETMPAVAAYLSHIQVVHNGLLTTQQGGESSLLASISQEQRTTDGLHDRLARGIWHGLEAARYLVADPARAAALAALQTMLFPEGLRVVQYSYRETAGHGELLASRLGAAEQELLASVPAPQGNLLDAVRAWLDAASRLGALDNERSRTAHAAESLTTPARARNQWIRAVRTVRSLIETLGTPDPALQAVLERIAQVEAAARRRADQAGDSEDDLDDGTDRIEPDPALD